MQLNAEIASQLKLISGNTDLMRKVLVYVKSLTAPAISSQKEDETERTRKYIKSFVGKWIDNRSADEMVDDIYAARKSKNEECLMNILNK